MNSQRLSLTPQKRSNESSEVGGFKRRTPDSLVVSSPDVSGSGRVYKLKILLPNGMTVLLKIPEGTEWITVKELANRAKNSYDRAVKKTSNPEKHVNWNADLYFLDDTDKRFSNSLKLTNLELNRVYNLRLRDGSAPAKIYENMWDLTPDTEILKELPEEYTFETALADIIDNSLQAVWSNDQQERRLISVEVSDDMISIVDTGPGMDNMSLEKWGKMGASLHRASKGQAIGGKPPYLKPAFGMFGYGGFVASMHLGRITEVSSKTKDSKKVYMLRLERDALVSGSGYGSKRSWRTYGDVRDPMKDELQVARDGSFTKVDIREPKMKDIDIRRLKCKLKDIYFPYIQCDELSKKGRTVMPVEFQVNDDDLAEIPGGEVAITNLNSCNGPEFVLQLRFVLNQDNTTTTTTSSPGKKSIEEANARLRCCYLPVKEGKESINNILESLKEDGYGCTEDFGSFSHVSCRRLGRLLPDARWAWLPFMDLRQKKGERSQVLKRICMRVKCFIETDAGFNPTPSKTDFAHQNPYANALRNLGSKQPAEKDMGVEIDIRKDGNPLNLSHLEKTYQQWLLQMHEKYDEEIDCGIDEPVFIVNPKNKKELHIANDVIRVHKGVMRKGKSWKSGQKIKILKGAYAGFHKTNVYAILEYIVLEGLQGDAGEAWIICRRIDISKEDGCVLESSIGNPVLDLRKSESLPINVIDSGKCLAVDESEWKNQLEKQYQKCPSSIEILDRKQCRELGIEGVIPDDPKINAKNIPRGEIVAVIRPASFKSGTTSKDLDQKYIMKDNFEMTLSVTFSKSGDDNKSIYSGRVTSSSRKELHGLYIFQPKCDSHSLFHKSGVYTFTFSIGDSSCQKCVVKVQVEASRDVHKWAVLNKNKDYNATVGQFCQPISVAMFDKYSNQIPFSKVPEIVVKVKPLKCTKGATVNLEVKKWITSTSPDKSALILKNLVIESSNLDNLRPSYDATLMLYRPDGSHIFETPLKVFPGPVKRVTVQQDNFEKQLIPGHVVKELTLELFDRYGNHVREKEKVQISMDGFESIERSFSVKKVDAHGCIDLGGLLKVTASYGKKLSLSVRPDGGLPVITKEWRIEERQLRTSSLIPETCFAGSQLENLEFEIVDSNGDVDVNFHDEDKIGESHTLVIKSQIIDESVKYSFREGRCIVRTVPVPSETCDFSFVASHACHPELHVTVKVRVEMPPVIEPLNFKHLSPDENIFPIMDSNTPMETHTLTDCTSVQHCISNNYADGNGIEPELESILDFQRDFEDELVGFGLKIGGHEENIKLLESQQSGIEAQLSGLDVSRYQNSPSTRSYGSPGKREITAQIECKTDSAAAVVIKLFKMVSDVPDEDCFGVIGRIIGVVALLGTAPTLTLSRILAEYLGDQMLAVVCKSYDDVILLETYENNGRVNRSHALHMFASELGQSINGRYGVICIDDIRACEARKDPEGNLIIPDPTLPNGTTPKGFLGYAVNMINIDFNYLKTMTDAGYGLRETLFYRLFGETQVYETRDDMKRAISSIKDGAVSLDGGILRGNGAMSLGCWDPDVIFPVANESMSQHAKNVMKCCNELKSKLKQTMEELDKENKSLESVKKKYTKRRHIYAKYFTRSQPIANSSDVSPVSCLDQKPAAIVGSCTPSPSYNYASLKRL